mmetsp:Transcript_4873/g.5631  ORF Transcript_4873/g.5631 Transcript_4873/m.5631 type:complete len:196 (+) Transcript_4873:154-741(+)|eukprot:CAMPEP_0184016908 /NCGR_PEP_ID=MMETSP0954-20121128/7204_1 /TAXON_ID=627963 /ORGANISM="Aplanochytrium sp, Strain PBS07" /LENGTH=195 /DNA_ID=CAMNT_0026298009 /DNA_START=189 /DNA_END=776 /DNA_ORIENTATION=+
MAAATEPASTTVEEVAADTPEGTVEDVEEEVPAETEESEVPTRGKGRQNRSEKKARKAIQKLGMKPYPGVKRVTVKKNKDILFIISQPDVLKSPSSDTFVIFGEAKVEDLTQQAASQAARQFAPSAEGSTDDMPSLTTPESSGAADGEIDESGVSPKDVEVVMSQAGCERAEAVEALKKNEGDIVNAIMELTMNE